MINTYRAKGREKNVSNLDFTLNRNAIPDDFLLADIEIDGNRHLIFGLEKIMDIMKNAAVYYLDGTFRVVNKPFMQLYTIHAFVNNDTNSKQIPMIYILMSGRRMVDYLAVFRKKKEIIGDEEIKRFVLDYERAAWTALRMYIQMQR